MSSSLRMRLTLWYVGAFSVVFIVFSAGVYFFVEQLLRDHLDANLRSTLQISSSALVRHAAAATSLSTIGSKGQVMGLSVADVLEPPRFPSQIVAILDPDGRVLARRPAASGSALRIPVFSLRPSRYPQFYELPESNSEADDSCRAIYQLASASGVPITVLVSDSMEPLKDQLDILQNVLMIAIVLALLLSGSGGWLLARHHLSPLVAMGLATERISASNLDERLPIHSKDELGRVASRFNDLLSRLGASFSQQRQFMADASHELRSPLSIVRTAAQVALLKAERPEGEYRESLTLIERQVERLTRIVEDMFALVRADMNQFPVHLEELYLDELIADMIRACKVLANGKGVHLSSQQMQETRYRGDERLLRQMISNLLDNAIQFTPSGGRVDVRLHRAGSCHEITVTDSGCGIQKELQPRIFERFFRGDKARAGENVYGAGLGLAIARSIAELHGGQLTLQHSGPEGSVFCVSLPVRELT